MDNINGVIIATIKCDPAGTLGAKLTNLPTPGITSYQKIVSMMGNENPMSENINAKNIVLFFGAQY